MKTRASAQPQPGVETENANALMAWQALVAETREQPWLLRLVLRQGEQLLARFVEQYQALLTLSRQRRRALLRQAGMGLAGAALLLALGGTPAFADTITVDGTCTLVDAITAANTDATVGNCIHSGTTGADTLNLTADVTLTAKYTLPAPSYNGGDVGLPPITSQITINGNGHTISRSSGATDNFRLLMVGFTGTYTSGGYTYGDTPIPGNLTLNNVTISGGNPPDGEGGAILAVGAYSANSELTLTNSTVSVNSASSGGGIASEYTVLTINNSTIANNTVPNENGYGGGLQSRGTTTIVNSTISGNSTTHANSSGGGIAIWQGSMTIENSTITGNSSGNFVYAAGGIRVSAPLTLDNSIVSGNSAGTNTAQANMLSEGTNVSSTTNKNIFGHNGNSYSSGFTPSTFGSIPAGALNTILNPTLADNGGPTLTHALPSGSPAIDAIDETVPRGRSSSAASAATCTPSSSHDQRGIFRANGTTTGTKCDIGAFEFGAAPTAVTIASFSGQTAFGSAPRLNWETAGESGLSGFHIWRGSPSAAESRLTDALIGAAGGLNGHAYTWQDALSFSWGPRYYWLEAVEADGSSTFTGPVEVQGIGRLFLPSIGR